MAILVMGVANIGEREAKAGPFLEERREQGYVSKDMIPNQSRVVEAHRRGGVAQGSATDVAQESPEAINNNTAALRRGEFVESWQSQHDLW